MPLEYFYNGNLRWTWHWENPNAWAVFLTCILPWIWWLENVWRRKQPRHMRGHMGTATLCLIEAGVWFLLAKTYSRGGFASAACAVLLFFLLRHDAFPRMRRYVHIAARLLLLAVLCFAAGGAGRIAPGHIVQDKSVLNRMELWQGALKMLNDSPFQGWGHGNSGMAYINWYQPLDATERPIGLVNSYLEVAVEHGIHWLFFVTALFGVLLCIVIAQRKHGRSIAAGACLVAWMTGNVWSSLWTDVLLWVIPGISMFLILAAGFHMRASWPKILAVAFGSASLMIAALMGVGHALSKNTRWRATPDARSGTVALTLKNSPETTGHPVCEIWADGAVFGTYFGRTIRWISDKSPADRFIVHPPWARKEDTGQVIAPIRIYSGFHAGRLGTEINRGKIVILHPTAFPPFNDTMECPAVTVCLPESDVSKYDLPWRAWASKTGARLIHSPQMGRDIHTSEEMEFWRSLLFHE
jgi:hypothetical protein